MYYFVYLLETACSSKWNSLVLSAADSQVTISTVAPTNLKIYEQSENLKMTGQLK